MISTKKIKSSDNVWKRLFSFLIFGLFIAATFGLSGCDIVPTTDGDEAEDLGQIVIGLTDEEGDFVNYTVDVVYLTLTKANGTVVSTLPISTRVDFAQYTEMTEFLTAATIPSGVYTEATLLLDYQDAEIWVEDSNGDSVEVETILDVDANPITTLEVSVRLAGRNSLLIIPGVPAHLTLDFNLNASNQVEFDAFDSPILTVQPFLVAEVNPEAPKIHRLRGPLKDVDVAGGTFEVIIRPFIHILSGGDDRFGTLEVRTDDETVYEINGEAYQGQAGLNAMDDLQTLAAVIVIGDLRFNPTRFEARQVYAGSSVPGGELDVVTGNVISRDSNMLTVKGATLIRTGGSVVFNNTLIVQLGVDTVVRRQLSREEYSIDDISVGQRVTVFGTLNIDETELDATEGYAHIQLTTISGLTVYTGLPWFVVDLNSIGRRRVSIFDFSGTGISPENDADPANYEIDVGSLDVSSISLGNPVKVRGFMNSFGQAPEDFQAWTVVDVSNVRACLAVNWVPPSSTAFDSISSENLTLNLEGVGIFHHLDRAGVVIDLTELLDSP
ncbi:MAG: metallophosphoesterase, partial [Candidatus Aminicenantes bacterium]|nr:metallophosphoesterase [Candidatus Aminicenantes bacterium]